MNNNNNIQPEEDFQDAEDADQQEQARLRAQEVLQRAQNQVQDQDQEPLPDLVALLNSSKIHSPLLTQPRTQTQQDELSPSITRALRAQIKQAKPEQFYKIQQSAEYGVKPSFHLLAPLDLTDESKKEQIFKDVYSITNRLTLFQKACHKFDMDDVFTVPTSMTYNPPTHQYIPAQNAKYVDMFSHHDALTLDTIKRWVSFLHAYADENVIDNLHWTATKISNSCNSDLRTKLEEKVNVLPPQHIGGPVYLKLLIDLIVSTSSTTFRAYIRLTEKTTLKSFSGENVLEACSWMRFLITNLQNHSTIPTDLYDLIFHLFSECSTPEFTRTVDFSEGLHQNKMLTQSISDLLISFETKYNELLWQNKWIAKSTTVNQSSTFSTSLNSKGDLMCWNCGAIGHGLRDCPHPKDEHAIEIRKRLTSRGGIANLGTNNQLFQASPNPKKVPPSPGQSQERKFNGQTYFWCAKCKRWTPSHGTSDHGKKQQANLANDAAQDIQPNEGFAGFSLANFR